jgi:hypothetical protein
LLASAGGAALSGVVPLFLAKARVTREHPVAHLAKLSAEKQQQQQTDGAVE